MDDERKREIEFLTTAYESLLEQETKAREKGNEKHLAICLAEQKKVQKKLSKLLPAKMKTKAKPVQTKKGRTGFLEDGRQAVIFDDGDELPVDFGGPFSLTRSAMLC